MSNSTQLSMLVEVRQKHVEAQNVVSFELVDPHGRSLPTFDAGAHIHVEAKTGLIRQYSLCNPPGEAHRYVIGVLREPESRGGSIAMHEEIQEGDLIRISAPQNHFPLVQSQSALLFAGGIGITPILAMADQLSREGRDFSMHYCARSKASMAFRERIAKSQYSEHARFHFDDGADNQKLNMEDLVQSADREAHVYVCGPRGFIEHVLNHFRTGGWAENQLHTEYFSNTQTADNSDVSFQVKIASTGASFEVPPEKTVHQVLTENGVNVLVSCEQGVCGTCLTGVLEGTPDHRDMYLDEEEHAANDQFTPCCSRSKSKTLVLDL